MKELSCPVEKRTMMPFRRLKKCQSSSFNAAIILKVSLITIFVILCVTQTATAYHPYASSEMGKSIDQSKYDNIETYTIIQNLISPQGCYKLSTIFNGNFCVWSVFLLLFLAYQLTVVLFRVTQMTFCLFGGSCLRKG